MKTFRPIASSESSAARIDPTRGDCRLESRRISLRWEGYVDSGRITQEQDCIDGSFIAQSYRLEAEEEQCPAYKVIRWPYLSLDRASRGTDWRTWLARILEAGRKGRKGSRHRYGRTGGRRGWSAVGVGARHVGASVAVCWENNAV